MPDTPNRDSKLIQYLNEAYGKEKQLETALEAHIAMTSRPSYRKRLRQHLQETKGHARAVERRIKQLGGEAEPVSVPGPSLVSEAAAKAQEAAQRGVALAQGPLHAVRGTSEQEKQLKNAKTEYSDEAEEIANYTAIETLAQSVGDRATATLARGIRRQEERMASFLERLIPTLTKEVVRAEIPASERNGGRSRRRTGGRTTSSSTRRKSSSSTRTGGTRRSTASGRAKRTGARSASRRRASGTARSGARTRAHRRTSARK